MSLPIHTLRAMRQEVEKRGMAPFLERKPVPEEGLTPARRGQALRDFLPVVGATGIGWGIGKTIGDLVHDRAVGNPVFREQVRKYGPKTVALIGLGTALATAKQRQILKERRDAAAERAGE